MYFPKGYTCWGWGGGWSVVFKVVLLPSQMESNQHHNIYKKELCGTYKISYICKAAECYVTPEKHHCLSGGGMITFSSPSVV